MKWVCGWLERLKPDARLTPTPTLTIPAKLHFPRRSFLLFITLSHMVLRDAISGMHRAQRNICTPKAHAARFHYPRSTLDGRFYPLFVQLLIAFAQSHKSSDVSSASRGRLWEN
jgi:hypothetical protein